MKAIKKIKEYLLLNEIGRGSFGKVYEALSEKTNKLYAIKALASENFKNPRVMEQLKKELKILFSLNHQNIIKIIGVEKTINNVYLILEYCNGGTLLDYITYYKKFYNKNLPEAIIQKIMKQVIEGLKFMHSNNVIHRDIKLENILISFDDLEVEFKFENEDKTNNKQTEEENNTSKNTNYFQNLNDFINSRHDLHIMHKIYAKKNLLEDKFSIKIADLGYARILNQSEASTTFCGTPLFMAPDIINLINKEKENNNYNSSIDIWSLGIVFYELLMGIPPFTASYNNEIFKKILAGVYKIPKNLKLSVEALSLLTGLMEFYPDKRCKIDELDSLPFIKRNVKDFVNVYTDKLDNEDPNSPFITIDSKETSSLLEKIIKYFKIELPGEGLEKKALYKILEEKVINKELQQIEIGNNQEEPKLNLKDCSITEETIVIIVTSNDNANLSNEDVSNEAQIKKEKEFIEPEAIENSVAEIALLEKPKKQIDLIENPISDRNSQGIQINENSEILVNIVEENHTLNKSSDDSVKNLVENQSNEAEKITTNQSDSQEYDDEFKNFILINEFKEEIDEDGFCLVQKDN